MRRTTIGNGLPGLVGTALMVLAACTSSGSTSLPTQRSLAGIHATSPASPSPPSEATGRRIDLSSLKGRIAFSGGPHPGEDIYVVNADSSGLRRVTTDPVTEFDPTWSPDGSRIAYRHQEDVGDDRDTDIFVVNADGSAPRNLTRSRLVSDWGPVWSPDGTTIAWNSMRDDPESGTMHGFIMDPNGSGTRRITDRIWVEYPAWSPDGTKIAFMAQEPWASGLDPDYNVYVMNADGSGITQLTDGPGSEGFPAWSPDGTRIAFSSTRDDCANSSAPDCLSTGDLGPFHALYVMNADGSDQARLGTTFAQLMDWSPDGRYIVFNGRRGLSVIRADGSGLTTLPVRVQDPSFPDWIA